MSRRGPKLDHERPCAWDTWPTAERERRVLLCLLDAKRAPLTAQQIGVRLGVNRTRRHGSGAKGPSSYSGWQSEASRVVPMLRSLEQRGHVHASYRRDTRYVNEYQLTGSGLQLARLAPRVVA